MSDKIRPVLRWLLGVEGAPEPNLAGEDLAFLNQVSAAAFAVAINIRFDDDVTAPQVQEFVSRIRGTHVNAEKLNPVLAEWVILDAFEKPVPVNDVPLAETITVQNLIAAGVVRDMNIVGDDLNQLMDDVVDVLTNPEEDDD